MGGLCLEKRLHDRLVPRVRKQRSNDVDPLRWCNHVVIYLITNIV